MFKNPAAIVAVRSAILYREKPLPLIRLPKIAELFVGFRDISACCTAIQKRYSPSTSKTSAVFFWGFVMTEKIGIRFVLFVL